MIPVCEPLLSGNELKYVTDCIKTNWISSMGKYIDEFENKFAEYCNVKYGICTTNGTTALHLALSSLGIKKGDEVIVPAFTMISTVYAILYCEAKPVLVDSEPDTWNMDVGKINEKITKNTKAIMPVHIYGHPVDMDPVLSLAKKYNLYIVEDAAEAHGALYKGKKTGALGNAGCFSFYANKIITTGEGGMVVTDDKEISDKARTIKNLSHSRKKRFLHEEFGYNHRMTNIQAAIGLAQFEKIDELIERRRKNARLYNSLLEKVEGITLPVEKSWAKNVYWMYSVLVDEKKYGMSRDDLMLKLREKGIDTRTFFIPMHEQPVFKKLGLFINERYPVSEMISQRGFYLPSGSGLKEEEIEYICETVKKHGK